jgi:hypothetical protein
MGRCTEWNEFTRKKEENFGYRRHRMRRVSFSTVNHVAEIVYALWAAALSSRSCSPLWTIAWNEFTRKKEENFGYR